MIRAIAVLGSGVLAVAAAACGGSTSTTPNPTSEIFETKGFADIAAGAVFRIEVDNIPSGRVTMTVDWNSGTAMSVYVATPSCVSGRDAISGACPRVALATGAARPKTVAFDNPRVETYYVYLHNEGPGAATGSMETRLAR